MLDLEPMASGEQPCVFASAGVVSLFALLRIVRWVSIMRIVHCLTFSIVMPQKGVLPQ